MPNQLFRIKPIDPNAAQSSDLKRVLGKWGLTFLGIGAIIGAGIFVMTGKAAGDHAGPALAISFIIAGIGCGFSGLCYAEFAAMLPISGSAYAYAYATLGEIIAWIIGWALVLEYLFAASTVAVSWSGYLTSFLGEHGIYLPQIIAKAPIIWDDKLGFVATGSIINLPAVAIIALLTSLLVIGISESAKMNNIIVFIKTSVIILFILFGFIYLLGNGFDNWKPFIPENTGEFGKFGWSGILAGAGTVFFAYIGFDAVSTAAQEARNPQKDMPFGILVSLAISTVLYIGVSLVLTGVVKYEEMSTQALQKLAVHQEPIALAVQRMVDYMGSSMAWLGFFVNLGALAGLTTVILVMLMGQPRIFYSMAKDGLLPPIFSKVHPRYQTPHINTMITGGIAILLAGIFPIGILGDLVVLGTLLAFTIVSIGVIILRKKNPEAYRPFKVPFVPVVPALGAAICVLLMLSKEPIAWVIFLGWMAIGLTIYFAYGNKNSRLKDS
ncbi:MAG: amino acid permease [Bacteroidia bacterium]|nr:amino acid permease [Bacteroidia bacterium]MDW8159620.1 amino acid permease [Bacteroidia bacterium]